MSEVETLAADAKIFRVDTATLLLSLAAAVFAGLTLWVATRQLGAARDALGGHGLTVQWTKTEQPKKDADDVTRFPMKATVYVVGPGRRYNVAVRADGLKVNSPLEVVPELHATSPPITVPFRASEDEIRSGWIVVTWVEPKGYGVIHRATRFSPDSSTPAEDWRWKRFMRVRIWLRRRQRPLHQWRRGMQSKPLGRWVRDPDLRVLPGEGPEPTSDTRREIRVHGERRPRIDDRGGAGSGIGADAVATSAGTRGKGNGRPCSHGRQGPGQAGRHPEEARVEGPVDC